MAKCNVELIAKIILIGINVLFIVIGFVIAAFGIVIVVGSNIFGGYIEPLFRDSGSSSVGYFFTYVAISATVLGSLILVLAVIGSCGACCKQKCVLYIYAGSMIFILMVEIAFAVVCVIKWDWVESQLKTSLQSSINSRYAGPTATDSISVAWNYAFVTFECCGVNNGTDLSSTEKWTSSDKIPKTCCIVNGIFPDHSDPVYADCTTNPTTSNSYQHKGCYQSMLDLILKYNDYMIGISIAIATLQICTLVAAIVIVKTSNKIEPQK